MEPGGAALTLSDNIFRLTRGHLTAAQGGVYRVPSLLDQLEAAFKPNNGGGAGGSAKAGLPINTTAVALWQDIEREATNYQHDLHGTSSRNVRAVIRSWVALTPSWEAHLTEATQKWCERIETLINPIKPYHPNQPCPACGQRFHGPERSTTLSLHWMDTDGNTLHPEEWAMDCAACGAQWSGKTLGAVAWAMAMEERQPT